MKDIFENAKFGDKFIDRENTVYVYLASADDLRFNRILVAENKPDLRLYYHRGVSGEWCRDEYSPKFNIVSRHHEPIDEEELDKLAFEEMVKAKGMKWMDAFKAGYRKAKEE